MTGQSARFECDCRQQSRPSGFVAGRKSIESALSGLDDLRSLPRIVGSRPDPGHVVIADDPRGEFDVVQLFSGAMIVSRWFRAVSSPLPPATAKLRRRPTVDSSLDFDPAATVRSYAAET